MDARARVRAVDAIERGAFAEAKTVCADCLRLYPNDPETLFLMGNAFARSGDAAGAIPLLERARVSAPRNVLVLNALGGAYAAEGQLDRAQRVLEHAVALDSQYPWALQNLGAVHSELANTAKARELFQSALQCRPDYAEALIGLADLAEKDGDHDEAQAFVERALRLSPFSALAHTVAARVDLRLGQAERAEMRLRKLLNGMPIPQRERAVTLSVLGHIYEMLEKFGKAFEAFALGNRILRELDAPKYEKARAANAPSTVAALTRFVREAEPDMWTEAPPVEGVTPTFLVGFPRSGTTLLETVLASHPQVETLEETETLTDAFEPQLLADGALSRWVDLRAEEVERYRRAYWRRVEAALGHKPSLPVFIDKMPLNTVLLPLIHRLFPGAKIIFAVRDPRDVVMSCFKQRFTLNIGMFQFLALDSAVRYYDGVMRLGDASREVFGLDMHTVHYEGVVNDFDTEIGSVLKFLDLQWSDGVRDYRAAIGQRAIRTPSALQVAKPLYSSSIGSWLRYSTQLGPYLETLDTWARRFGYEAH